MATTPHPVRLRHIRTRARLLIAGALALTTAASLVLVEPTPGLAAVKPGRPGQPAATSVAVGTVGARAATRSQTDGPGLTTIDHATRPVAATADVRVGGAAATVGGLPVTVTAAEQRSEFARASASAAPASVHVEVVAPSVAKALGITGAVVKLARADGVRTGGSVRLRLDYSGFANAFGANFGSRLRLVRLPACALSTPDDPACQRQSDLGAVNAGGAVTADVSLPGGADQLTSSAVAPVVLALTGSTSSSEGTFSATSLSPAYAWSAGNQGGSFSYDYPLRVPPPIGGPAPDLALSYDSGSVDAQTLAENGQTSWVGEGWNLQTGYIERSYRPCSQDGGSTADACWFSSFNATMVFKGSSVRLVRDNTTGVWHGSADAGLKIEQLTDASRGNGDNDGEFWRVTTQDGTQYYFGANKRYAGDPAATNSTLVEPVYGNNSGEPCFNATFANAWCNQAYRWNLDYVVDPHGNSMTLFYAKSSGYVGLNNNTNVRPYDYDGTLDHIDYGTRAGSEGAGNAPMQVWFTRAGRCVNACQVGTSDYPDTPWDLYCSSSTSCPSLTSAAFWSQYRLASVYTRVWDPALNNYRKVDQWDLAHTYPASGDNISPAGNDTSPNLWLQTVTHTGYAADGFTSLAEPSLTFGGTAMFNRVDWGNDLGVAPYTHYRISSVTNGMGGQTLVTYSNAECSRSFVPNVEANPYRCFPEYFKPTLAPAGWGWFQKYVVTAVTERDLTGGSPDETWTYAYSAAGTSDPSLWHHDYTETVQLAFRSWSLWFGYPTVTVTHGPSGGPQTVTRTLYYRGMDADGMATTMNDAMVWGSRRVGVTRPVTQGAASGIAGSGGGCLNIAGGSAANGANIELNDCTGAASQVFQQTSGFALVNPVSGKCVDITGGGTANGTNVELWTCTGGANQIWRRQPDGSLKNPASGRCLEVNGARVANGSNVDIWDCPTNGFNVVWLPRADGTLIQPQERRCIDIHGAATVDGTHIESYTCLGQANQQWQLQSNGALRNPVSGKCLDITGAGTAAGTPMQLWTCTGATNQVWTAQADGGLRNPASNRCLDGTATPYNGIQLVLGDCSATSRSQRWVSYLVDADGLQGRPHEADDLEAGSVVHSSIHISTATGTALRSAPVTGGQDISAVMATETDTWERSWLPVSGVWRTGESQATYDTYGLPVDVRDYGNVAVGSDDVCTHTDYARNTSGTNYLINFPSQQLTTDCAASPGDADYLAGTQTFYDGSTTLGSAPSRGLATLTKKLASVVGGAQTWAQDARAGFDANGRETARYDALDRSTTTVYTPASAGPVTQVTTTDPASNVSTATIEPGKSSVTATTDPNGKTTSARYDPLGRLLRGWLNNRPTTATPDRQYTYTTGAGAPNVIQEQVLGPSGNQISIYKIYDGRTRLRQVQEPAPVANGGRMIADTAYDGRGLAVKQSALWNNASPPSGSLATFTDASVPSQRRFSFDTMERKTADAVWSLGVQQYQTTYAYQGDRAAELAPTGGTTTQTLFDARGHLVEQRQYPSASTSGSYQSTSYAYDRLGHVVSTTDPAGNVWTRTIDLRERLVAESSPDTGTSTYTYDNAGQMLTSTDGRGVVTAYAYDALGRRTSERKDSSSGPLLNSWTYDTLATGQVTSSTSYVGSAAYTVAVTGYDDAYNALGTAVTVPAGEGGLTGTWTTTSTQNVDGSPASLTYPAVGPLGGETVNYTYDANGFQLTAAGTSTYVSGSAFQPWGDLYQLTLGSASSGKRVLLTTEEFADTHHTKSLQVGTESPTTPGSYDEALTEQYHWDPAGNLTSVDTQHAGSTVDSQCFGYDYLRQLTTAWTTTPGAGGCAVAPSTSTVGGADPYWTSWTYNMTTGNRTGETRHGLGGAGDTVSTYAYPAGGSAHPHGLGTVTTTGPAAGSKSFVYNGAGQVASTTVNGETTDFTWTPGGRLDTATRHAAGGDQATSYVYDSAGGVLIRKTPTGNTLYLGGTEVHTDGAGALAGAVRYYLCNGTLVASRTMDGTLSWLAADHLGTARVSIDAATLATTVRRQDPFGNPRGSAPAWPNERGFVGGTSEPTGLVHLGARMYDATTGRFISADSVFNAGDPQEVNGYSYAANNPTSGSDPTGNNPGSVGGHETAIIMRMEVLQAQYPNAIIQGSIPSNQGGPDLVCWGCAPGQVWVWEFKSENNRSGEAAMILEIQRHMAQAAADPRSAGMTVIAGPTFGSLGLPPLQVGLNHVNPTEMITVYDGQPGLQLYAADDPPPAPIHVRQVKNGSGAAVAAKPKSNTKPSTKSAPPPTKKSGSQPKQPTKNNPGRPQLDDGAVKGGSFLGDVILFATVIFAIEVLIYLAVEAAIAAAEAAAEAAMARYVAEGIAEAERFANAAHKVWCTLFC